MHRMLVFVVLLAGCGEIPSSALLDAAESDFQQSHIDGTAKPGFCETPDNLEVLKPDNHLFAERWSEFSGMSGLDVDALHAEFPTTTKDCLNCFNSMTKCAVSNCGLGICDPVFGYGQRHLKCRECTQNACGAEMIKCSGLLPEQWPDFRRGQS